MRSPVPISWDDLTELTERERVLARFIFGDVDVRDVTITDFTVDGVRLPDIVRGVVHREHRRAS